MAISFRSQLQNIAPPLMLLSIASLCLIGVRLVLAGNTRYWFLPWNLLLAWVPLLLALVLRRVADRYQWTSWQFIAVFAGWLLFLPNTFYIVTDFMHLHDTGEVSILYDAVTMMLFSLSGVLLGFVSLLTVENELRRGLGRKATTAVVAAIILLCSFAIYLGRYLRWNTWDVVASPGGLFLDVTDRILRPFDHPLAVTTTLLFFVFILAAYYGLKLFVASLKKLEK